MTLNQTQIMPTKELPANMQQAINGIARRELIAPLLLFLAGHRPLAFVAGQTLHLAAPAGGLLGFDSWSEWAALLSDPRGPDMLLEALDHAQ